MPVIRALPILGQPGMAGRYEGNLGIMVNLTNDEVTFMDVRMYKWSLYGCPDVVWFNVYAV